ncbi:hypothetical protein K5I29_05990 [Flavobacterium agricola]|uniref:Anti-sigma factor n=1 Tax=Flavobacterium agricola TaxID=2870839 RepID=A0ABY6M497_9FLAO|nr:hypothetical protein [Flavobacterium agricola]UYW02440.1 hypothetical protein K5I29_05990 [Flavobacterium agricola]
MNKLYKTTEDWDFLEPNNGHEMRFIKKLEAQAKPVKKIKYNAYISWAAVLVLSICFGIYYVQNQPVQNQNSSTQNYYSNQIALQIHTLKELETPLTKPIINDAIQEINKLEADYNKLEKERKAKGSNEQLLNAMIVNLQTRIDFLQRVQSQINQINELKKSSNENIL